MKFSRCLSVLETKNKIGRTTSLLFQLFFAYRCLNSRVEPTTLTMYRRGFCNFVANSLSPQLHLPLFAVLSRIKARAHSLLRWWLMSTAQRSLNKNDSRTIKLARRSSWINPLQSPWDSFVHSFVNSFELPCMQGDHWPCNWRLFRAKLCREFL